ncbi:uncharacterized protein LOC134235969 [Saccostrea cucullata]|uniref:uncharacterized protein LOC134235969 n=1 Tax=Saccostrea cuccullata TaxID=36930 RepID=UPI002ED3C7EC
MPRAARRNATRQRPVQVVSTSAVESSATLLDMDNPLNWTVAQLRERLTQLGIQVPKGFNASTLRQLYNENINKGDVTERRENSHEGSLGGSDATNNGVPLQTLGESTVTNTNNDGVLLQTLQSMAQSCAALQQTVNTLLAKENKKDAEKEDDNPLKKYAAQVHTDSASAGEVQAGGSSSREESDGLPTGIRSNLELGQVVQKLMNNSVTERTRLTYKQGFETYKHFLTIHGVFYDVKCPPISEDILVHFVAYCQHNLLLKFSTIRLYLCGIRYMFLEMGIPNPFQSKCHSMERLKLILNAIGKVQSKMPSACRIQSKQLQLCNWYLVLMLGD